MPGPAPILPTLLELHLRDVLEELPRVDVAMWPGELRPDEYDLGITVTAPGRRKRVWRVDAKAWESVTALADTLEERDGPPFP